MGRAQGTLNPWLLEQNVTCKEEAMGFGLCDSWEQEAVPQESPGQGATPGCERDGHADKEQRGLPPLASKLPPPAWRRRPGTRAGDTSGKEWVRQLRSGTGSGTGPLLVD